MDISDFDGNQKFKYIIPMVYIFNWVLIITGPIFFPVYHQYYCCVAWIGMLLKMISLDFNMVVILKRTFETFSTKKEAVESEHETLTLASDIVHCFIIPSYREDPELIAETLSWIAAHPRAKSNYMIMLAMEKHEENSDLKAQEIIKKHKHLFRVMEYTRHEMREHEQKGKASNVSWCGEHLEEVFTKYAIDSNNVLITIIDADTWAPGLYITKIEEYIVANPENKDLAIFVPPQIFTRNHLEVPIFTRIYDNTHSLTQLSNMRSNFDLIFPVSNYSLSYNLIKSIGFWDTCQDAIGEDFHTNQKAFWKTNGKAFNVPIYVPFNQVNVQTGKGYIQDVEARFWQAERHAQGCADVAYNINMILKTQLWTPKALLVIYYIAECFFLPAIMPWIAFSTFLQNNIFFYFWDKPEGIIPISTMTFIMNLTTISSLFFWGFYEIFKRYTNKKLYSKENESIWRLIEYPMVVSLDITFIAIPTFIIAAFRVLMKNREYRLAEKIISQ